MGKIKAIRYKCLGCRREKDVSVLGDYIEVKDLRCRSCAGEKMKVEMVYEGEGNG